MSIQVILGDRALILNFSSWAAVTNLRSRIEIPYTSIDELQVGAFEFPLTAIRKTGISALNYKAGVFVIDGKKYLLSYRDASKVVILGLKEHEFNKIVIESEAPEQLVNNLLLRSS
ncbi:PH domain-containing protein [Paenibacillus sp. GCM10027626]|uniref:PH domain-containing protein n=1 Tax=Paenibacillus sp. GCM10027626 TaxID=3273411 RepID=UPI003644A3D1